MQARTARPHWCSCRTWRWTSFAARRTTSAIESYREAVDSGERDPTVMRTLVQLLYERQRFAEADRILAIWNRTPRPTLPM